MVPEGVRWSKKKPAMTDWRNRWSLLPAWWNTAGFHLSQLSCLLKSLWAVLHYFFRGFQVLWRKWHGSFTGAWGHHLIWPYGHRNVKLFDTFLCESNHICLPMNAARETTHWMWLGGFHFVFKVYHQVGQNQTHSPISISIPVLKWGRLPSCFYQNTYFLYICYVQTGNGVIPSNSCSVGKPLPHLKLLK